MSDIPKQKKSLSPALLEALKKSGAAVASEACIADDVLSTGFLSLDRIMGGGWAKHRINELNGDSGAGKTTLALGTVVEVQKDPDAIAAWADSENSFSLALAMACGVDMDRLIYLGPTVVEKGDKRPRTGEEFCDFVEQMVESGDVRLVVIDSIGALTPKKKFEKEFGEGEAPAQRARLVGTLAEKLLGGLAGYDCTLLAINHLTGLLQTDFVGNQRTTTKGGKTWNYLKSTSLNLKASKTEGAEGNFHAEVEAEVLKCRRAPRGGKTSLLNVMGKGFSVLDDLIEVGSKLGIIEINKGWISFNDRKFNGRAKFADALTADEGLLTLLRDTIEAQL